MSTKKIGKNVVSNMVGVFGQLTIAFLISPFLVHSLGDTRYGIWAIAVAFTGYMNLMDLGISSAINKYVSKYNGLRDEASINSIITTAVLLFLVLGLIIVVLSPLMANLVVGLVQIDSSLTSVVHLLIIIVSFDIGIFIIGGLYRGIFGGFQQYAVINYTQITSAIYKAIMFYLFLSKGYGLIAMGLVSITANLLAIFIYFIILKKAHPFIRFELNFANKSSVSKIVHYSKFTFLAMMANQIIYYSDAFVIGYFMSAAAVTYYSIAWTLAEYTKKISHAISQTYAPAVSEQEALGDLGKVREFYISGMRYMIIVSNLLTVGVLVLGGAFIAIWMGPKYRELCETVLIILIINQFILGPQQISYAILKGLAIQKYYSYMSILVSVINLILSIILVQSYGIVGVALGAAIPQIVFNAILVPWMTLNALQQPGLEFFKKTYLLSLVPTLILFGSLYYFKVYHYPEGYLEIILTASLCSALYLIVVYLLMLSQFEKSVVRKYVCKKFKMA